MEALRSARAATKPTKAGGFSPSRPNQIGTRGILYAVQHCLTFSAVVVFVVALTVDSLELAFSAVMLMYAGNLIFGFLRIRERLLFVFLHLGIALFLLTRPLIGSLDPERSWFLSSWDSTMFALTSIFVSLSFLLVGNVLADCLAAYNQSRANRRERMASCRCENPTKREKARVRSLVECVYDVRESDKMRYVRLAALLCFLVCFLASCYVGFVKLSYMQGLSYEQYYLIDLSERIPWVIDALNVMTPYTMCAYLAAMPKRSRTLVVLALYVATTLPMLMIGSRADFVIAFLFAALYFAFRAMTDTTEVWISRRTVVLVAVFVPVGILAMGVINYTRSGDAIIGMSAFDLLADALFKQGVSFTVLGHGYDVNAQIQSLGFKFYTLGGLTSTITEGFIGTTFFGCEDLGSTNSAKLALEGFSYTHAMSFFAHPNYLGGEGYGSSYILELYADFGVGGIAVGSLLLSCALRALSCAMGRSWFWGTVALISSMSVFHMPRGTALEWISFLWATRFLLAVVLVMVGAALLAYVGRVLRTRTRHVGKVGVLAGCSSCQWEAAEAARPLVMGETDGGSARNKFGVRVCPIVRSE